MSVNYLGILQTFAIKTGFPVHQKYVNYLGILQTFAIKTGFPVHQK